MDIDTGISGFTVDKHVAGIAHSIAEVSKNKKKSTLGLKAREHYLLMMVFLLLFMLCHANFG